MSDEVWQQSDWEQLISLARQAQQMAYAPYSGYLVGAAVETLDGRVFAGCNVENASSGLTICAERTAVFAAVSAGCRSLRRLVVVTANGAPPCGACLQVLSEFSDALPILLVDQQGQQYHTTLGRLLPIPFKTLPPYKKGSDVGQ